MRGLVVFGTSRQKNAALTLSLPFEAGCLELDGHNGEREGKVGSETHHLVQQV